MTVIGQQWQNVTIVQVEVEGFTHTRGFDEVVVLLQAGFSSLGIPAIVAVNQFSATGVNIVLGAHVLSRLPASARPDFPPNTVIFNLEQIDPASPWIDEYYISVLKSHPVWDYSCANVARLKQDFGIVRVALMRIGHAAALSRIQSNSSPDIDVLFYGQLSPRRARILMDVAETGINLVSLSGVYGSERDAFIARAKLILNIRYYDFPGVAEIVRFAYLLSNRKVVVSEWREDVAIESDIKQCVVLAKYDDLVETCFAISRNDSTRRAIEDRGYSIFSKRDQKVFLREAICNTAFDP